MSELVTIHFSFFALARLLLAVRVAVAVDFLIIQNAVELCENGFFGLLDGESADLRLVVSGCRQYLIEFVLHFSFLSWF